MQGSSKPRYWLAVGFSAETDDDALLKGSKQDVSMGWDLRAFQALL